MVDDRSPRIRPGDILDGKYLVDRVVGEGGMGLVIAARHTVLDKDVAIKLLSSAESAETIARFHREARSAVRLKSAHTARVHDVGQLANGEPYMVMDLLRGSDLKEVIEKQRCLPVAQAVGWVLQALDALEEAHALGIVHRDLKPANLFLADQPEGPPIIKVLDFGIACDFQEVTEDHRLTSTRDVFGSPTYMSPEQMRAARGVDARSDIWSIGVCLYELLAGTVPFEAPTLPDLMVAVLHHVPPPPTSPLGPLPAGLSEIVLRCIEKDPARRFASASELARALAPYASAELSSSPRGVGQMVLPDASSTRAVSATQDSLADTIADANSVANASAHAAGRRSPALAIGTTALILLVGLGGFAFKLKGSHPVATANATSATTAPSTTTSVAIEEPPALPNTSTSTVAPETAAPPSSSSAKPIAASRPRKPPQISKAGAPAETGTATAPTPEVKPVPTERAVGRHD